MQNMAVIHILVHKKTNSCLIVRFVRKRIGTLEGWFSHGKLYRYTKEEMIKAGWDNIYKILNDAQEDYASDKSEYELVKLSHKQFKIISVALSPDEIVIAPFEKVDRYGGAVGKNTSKIKLPVDNKIFIDQLEKAIEDAE